MSCACISLLVTLKQGNFNTVMKQIIVIITWRRPVLLTTHLWKQEPTKKSPVKHLEKNATHSIIFYDSCIFYYLFRSVSHYTYVFITFSVALCIKQEFFEHLNILSVINLVIRAFFTPWHNQNITSNTIFYCLIIKKHVSFVFHVKFINSQRTIHIYKNINYYSLNESV